MKQRNFISSFKKLCFPKRAQEFPGWFVILGLILGLLILIFLIWLSVKSGQKGTEILPGLA
jgi:hypothetical protein